MSRLIRIRCPGRSPAELDLDQPDGLRQAVRDGTFDDVTSLEVWENGDWCLRPPLEIPELASLFNARPAGSSSAVGAVIKGESLRASNAEIKSVFLSARPVPADPKVNSIDTTPYTARPEALVETVSASEADFRDEIRALAAKQRRMDSQLKPLIAASADAGKAGPADLTHAELAAQVAALARDVGILKDALSSHQANFGRQIDRRIDQALKQHAARPYAPPAAARPTSTASPDPLHRGAPALVQTAEPSVQPPAPSPLSSAHGPATAASVAQDALSDAASPPDHDPEPRLSAYRELLTIRAKSRAYADLFHGFDAVHTLRLGAEGGLVAVPFTGSGGGEFVIALRTCRDFLLVPGYDYVSEFVSTFATSLQNPKDILAAFDLQAKDPRQLRLEVPGHAAIDGRGQVSIDRRGRLSGYSG